MLKLKKTSCRNGLGMSADHSGGPTLLTSCSMSENVVTLFPMTRDLYIPLEAPRESGGRVGVPAPKVPKCGERHSSLDTVQVGTGGGRSRIPARHLPLHYALIAAAISVTFEGRLPCPQRLAPTSGLGGTNIAKS